MEINLDDFRRHFGLLSDEALLATNRQDLVAAARACYDDEVNRRGLNAPPEGEAPAEETRDEHPEQHADLVLIATYSIAEEASLARGLLLSAEIPVLVENELIPLGGYQIRVLVPAEFEEQAQEILASEISDEDLAAQAEAAGMLAEKDSEEDSEKDSEEGDGNEEEATSEPG